jgi:hypothetical protein
MANVLYIKSAYVKTPKKLTVGIYDVAKNADRNAAGEILIDRVAVKRKIECEWGALTNSEISTILGSVTDVFFTVKYPDPLTGTEKTITAYVGDRTAPIYKDSGTPLWEGLTMNLIEK